MKCIKLPNFLQCALWKKLAFNTVPQPKPSGLQASKFRSQRSNKKANFSQKGLQLKNQQLPTKLEVSDFIKDLSQLCKEPYRDWFALQFLFVQVLESLGRVLSPVHADEGTAPGRDQVDGLDGAELSERVRQFFIADKLGQVSHPQSCTAHCKKFLSVNSC